MSEVAVVPKMDTDLIDLLKDKFIDFIWRDCEIPTEHKLKIRTSMGSNWFDDRFQIKELEDIMAHRYTLTHEELIHRLWTDQHTLWVDVCKAASQHSDKPHEIADAAVERYMATMNKIKTNL